MGAFGERLRREREMRGITLDEISESTKISRRHLESLEKEDFNSLPGGIFNKGFVRAYARFLGIDEDQAVADYSAVTTEQAAPPDRFPLEVHEPSRELNPPRLPMSLLVAVAGLAVVLAVVWSWSRGRRPDSAEPPAPAISTKAPAAAPPVSETTAVPSPTPAAATVSETTAAPSPTPAAATVSAATPVPSPTPATATVSSTSAVPSPTSATTTVSETPTVPSRSPTATTPAHTPTQLRPTADHRTFVVVVRAKEDAWVALQSDGRTVWQGVLKAKKWRAVKATKQVLLTTGNAGGLVVSHNGRSVGAIGSESEVRTLMFNTTGRVK